MQLLCSTEKLSTECCGNLHYITTNIICSEICDIVVTSIEPSNSSVLRAKLCRKSGIRLTEVPLDYDKVEHQFQATADIRCHPVCKSDIGLVITSYEKTIGK